jgi:hypothetical protein
MVIGAGLQNQRTAQRGYNQHQRRRREYATEHPDTEPLLEFSGKHANLALGISLQQ